MNKHPYTLELEDDLDLIYLKRLLIRVLAEEAQGVAHDDAVITLADKLLTQVVINLDRLAKGREDD